MDGVYGGVLVRAWRIGAMAVILVGLSGCEGDPGEPGGVEETPQLSLVDRLSAAQIGGQQVEFVEGEAPESDDLDLSTEPSECLPFVYPTLTLAGADLAEARLEGREGETPLIISAATLDSGAGAAVLEDLDGRVEQCSGSIDIEVSGDAAQPDETSGESATLLWEDETPDRRAWRVGADGEHLYTDYVAVVDDASIVFLMSSPQGGDEEPDLSAVADDVLSAMEAG
jgi:hypothetical protein